MNRVSPPWYASPPPLPSRNPKPGHAGIALLGLLAAGLALPSASQAAVACDRTITADVVVLDNPTVFNRLGAQNPNWITYALKRDVVFQNRGNPNDARNGTPCTMTQCTAGNVELRPDKRPRPLVVRSVTGACLDITFTNLLDPRPNPNPAQQDNLFNDNQVADRHAGFHPQGVELVGGMASDASYVGTNANSLVLPGQWTTYRFYTPHEGTFTVNSYGATIGSEANSGNLGLGMFAQLNVQPKGARIYRSQVTEEEMRLATVGTTAFGQPIIDYEATYPTFAPWTLEGKAGLPVLNMITAAGELVHSDINAIIAGPDADGSWNSMCPGSNCPYPLESVGKQNPQVPERLKPFREFSSIYHDEQTNSQVFPLWYNDPVLGYTLKGVGDVFMINYGSGGIGSEIISNRLRTGPMHDCTNCAYEEFFLASQTVGDPGLLVNFPANTGIEQCDPAAIAGPTCWRDPVNLRNGPVAQFDPLTGDLLQLLDNYALYQEDPSNVHHAYTGDQVKIRNVHAGAFEQHIFHLHNHQWLFNPNDDNSNYLDAQEIMPGSGHTYELANGGAGNRNKTSGDAIFHCHFYPHFAQGMWYHIRNMDVLETGTRLAVSGGAGPDDFHTEPFALRSGQPLAGARALPDGELPDGVPIPAIVPLPGQAMPPLPAKVSIAAVDRGGYSVLGGRTGPDGIPDSGQAVVKRACNVNVPGDCDDAVAGPDGDIGTADDKNPGFPFWLAGNECGVPTATDTCPQGIVGQRMPTPPLDMLTETGATAAGFNPAQAGGWDGGLPRHALRGYTSAGVSLDTQNRLNFSKIVEMAQPVYFPETGTDLEQVAMAYHAVRERLSFANLLPTTPGTTPEPVAKTFVTNGAPPVPGGPFQDPCIDDRGNPLVAGVLGQFWDGDRDDVYATRGSSFFSSDNPRTYRVANVQVDAVFNKVGYHYPQERMISLWEDVAPLVNKQRPPQPLVMRFNTFDCGKILHTNLVPAEFELDDFQVRTPTDIIGQHIHLPKWDLTTNDGAANGWNYEDGALSPGAVRERILAINKFNEKVLACQADSTKCILLPGTVPGQLGPINLTGLAPVPTIATGDAGSAVAPGLTELVALPHPFFGAIAGNPQTPDYLGARTVIQRIFEDPIVNVSGVDRGLGITFSHDHYGPSTFQQIGLYSTIIVEPAGSRWVHNETGVQIGQGPDGSNPTGRIDGGPTTWQAAIITPNAPVGQNTVQSHTIKDHREFYFEMSDFQHAYEAGTYVGANAQGIPVHTEINQPDPFNATQAFAPALQNTWKLAVNPSLKLKSTPFPDVVTANNGCPGPAGNFDPSVPRPCAEAINIAHGSMFVVNYRNEPVGLRVFNPNAVGPDGKQGAQTAGLAGDLAFAFDTRRDRAIAALNTSRGNTPYPAGSHCLLGVGDLINCDRRPGDPFTPMMRAYQRDDVKVKIQVGATEEQHQATIHGMKWLSNGSGFGRSGNSGWRNFQSHGISEQFSLQTPVNPDPGQFGRTADYLYASDATRDGIWSGAWGVMRVYGRRRADLFQLPDNPAEQAVVNLNEFDGVCPKVAPRKQFDVTVVLANNVLPNALGVTIPRNANRDSNGDGLGDNAGGPLNPLGGTLVYNRRGTVVPTITFPADGNEPAFTAQGGQGPLNDPTAMLYVPTSDLEPLPQAQLTLAQRVACRRGGVNNLNCPVRLKATAPVEPLALRANAGDCIDVVLRNRLPAVTPDLAGWQDMLWVVNRDLFKAARPDEMHFFNNNLIRPSGYAGLHTQLLEYDVTRSDGLNVGVNLLSGLTNLAPPGGVQNYRWYAGDLSTEPTVGGLRLVATPVEFGAVNLLSADRVKQPQKGLFGALVVEPVGATVTANTLVPDGQGTGAATRLTRAQVTVTAPPGTAGSGGTYREALAMSHRIANLRWKDGSVVVNVNQGELGREGAEDSGHAGFNYAMEPSWFRFKLPPDAPFGNAGTPNSYGSIGNAHAMYANALVTQEPNTIQAIAGVSALGDPVTPVFRATAGANNPVKDTRMYVLNGASADRDGTFMLHGHVWQRDPYVCTGTTQDTAVPLPGRCAPNTPVPSLALGDNPQGKWVGSQEGLGHVFGYWPILFDAGGTDGVTGDYLYRDYAPTGNRNGQFGILRVQ